MSCYHINRLGSTVATARSAEDAAFALRTMANDDAVATLAAQYERGAHPQKLVELQALYESYYDITGPHVSVEDEEHAA